MNLTEITNDGAALTPKQLRSVATCVVDAEDILPDDRGMFINGYLLGLLYAAQVVKSDIPIELAARMEEWELKGFLV